MYKLRTMSVNAPDFRQPDGSAFSAADDPRQTQVGSWLRRTSFDELPQLLNVLKGDMSFIGPRPDDLKEAALYNEEEARKLEQRPGISGYAQVYGRNAINWHERLALDVEYINKISFALDVKIFFRTFAVVFMQRDIYGDKPADDVVENTHMTNDRASQIEEKNQ
jgi:lipopolysaccharide/colanic/teichoic acid biosynthesis glycosyltransferase